jgi:serine/threonine protein phosphatase 1
VFWRRILGRRDQRREPRFRTAPGVRLYAIGDIHGRADLLTQVLASVDLDIRRYPGRRCITVLLGDYIDRGHDSRAVIEILMARVRTSETVCLMGNHELMLQRFLADPELWDAWAPSGGIPTLVSYGIRPPLRATPEQRVQLAREFSAALPRDHLKFLAGLPFLYESGDILFVHAGVRPGRPVALQDPEDLTWIREEFLSFRGDFGRFVVHGHTPVDEPDLHPNRINIDTGAYATGRLSCLILEDEKLTFL